MICRVEALRYRCLKYIKKELGGFHILVGPNASGKSTFLDVVSFLGDIVREGLETAVRKRTPSYTDLIWLKEENTFELAIEMALKCRHGRFLMARSGCLP